MRSFKKIAISCDVGRLLYGKEGETHYVNHLLVFGSIYPRNPPNQNGVWFMNILVAEDVLMHYGNKCMKHLTYIFSHTFKDVTSTEIIPQSSISS